MNKNIKNALLLSAVMAFGGSASAMQKTDSFADFGDLTSADLSSRPLPSKLFSSRTKAADGDEGGFVDAVTARRDALKKHIGSLNTTGKPADLDKIALEAAVPSLKPEEMLDESDRPGNSTFKEIKKGPDGKSYAVYVDNDDALDVEIRLTKDNTKAHQAVITERLKKDAERKKEQEAWQQRHDLATALHSEAEDLLADTAKTAKERYKALSFGETQKQELVTEFGKLGLTLENPEAADKALLTQLQAASGRIKAAAVTKSIELANDDKDAVLVGDLKTADLKNLWKLVPQAKALLQKMKNENVNLNAKLKAATLANTSSGSKDSGGEEQHDGFVAPPAPVTRTDSGGFMFDGTRFSSEADAIKAQNASKPKLPSGAYEEDGRWYNQNGQPINRSDYK